MTYFSFWAILSLISSGMIAVVSAGILLIVAGVLMNIPLFLFIYCSIKMGKFQEKPEKEEKYEEETQIDLKNSQKNLAF